MKSTHYIMTILLIWPGLTFSQINGRKKQYSKFKIQLKLMINNKIALNGAWSITEEVWTTRWWRESQVQTAARFCVRKAKETKPVKSSLSIRHLRRGRAVTTSRGWTLSTRWRGTGTPAGSSPPPARPSPAPPACPGPGSARGAGEGPAAAKWSLSSHPGTQVSGQRSAQEVTTDKCDAGDYQWNRLGVFQYQYDAPDGRPVYFKVSSEYQSIISTIKHSRDCIFQEKDSQWLYFVQYPYVWWVDQVSRM